MANRLTSSLRWLSLSTQTLTRLIVIDKSTFFLSLCKVVELSEADNIGWGSWISRDDSWQSPQGRHCWFLMVCKISTVSLEIRSVQTTKLRLNQRWSCQFSCKRTKVHMHSTELSQGGLMTFNVAYVWYDKLPCHTCQHVDNAARCEGCWIIGQVP